MHGPVKVPLSRVFRGRAEECRTMAELFRSEKTREHLLKVAADYENMSDRAAIFELQDADREAGIIPFAQRVMRWS
jgi:hypothetical protein